jgi:peptidoglycan hydrolase-like protein with peptidoglycan-binding domain
MLSEKLDIGSVGEEVTRLQEALDARGFAVSPEEAKRKFFGPSTRDSVRECQTCHGLEATGELNEATALLLDETGATPNSAPQVGDVAAAIPLAAVTPIIEAASGIVDVATPPGPEFERNVRAIKGHPEGTDLTSLTNDRIAALTQPSGIDRVQATTVPPAPAAPAVTSIVESSAGMPRNEPVVITEGATAGPFVMASAPFLSPAVLATKPKATLTESPSSVTDAAFKEDDKVRAVLTKHLAVRAKNSLRIAERASRAFENFLPSTFTSADREARNYLAPGEDLPQAMNRIVKKGLTAMNESSERRTLRIHVGGELENFVTTAPAGGRKIRFDGLHKHLRRLLAEAPTLANDPTRAACDAEARASKILAQVEGTDTDDVPATPETPLVEGPGATENGNASLVKQFVSKHVDGLLANVASPEEELLYIVNKRATLKDTETNVDSFQLRKGASDVTSYHDFRSLYIAFEHIWTEIFDGKLKSLGMALYHEGVKLENFLRPDGTKLPSAITSKADLLKLLGEIRALSDVAADSVPDNGSIIVKPPGVRGVLTGGFSLLMPEVVTEKSDDAPDSTKEDKGPVASIPGATRLSRLLDEIERRLNEGYSFHVFADRSVNFGMMVTYRQTWRPESYQVGDLVSTIPLAPRETRRYTKKRVVKKTRAVKEVEDSVRTTRSDTSGTSRVEREIVDKAQDKTNFDLTTHGSIGGEGYQADATAKVGGEHATQSEKAKKHFHEAVLKSAMEYKQQHRMEIDTTAAEETEETTFHEIQNPNDELTVTYMFYELQRTYRISEKIHQLTPVVLVANEVPAPDAIDDAWLTTHDWILRRVLLDDSFKPALEYLIKSFIGAEINLQILSTNAKSQKQIVDGVKQQIERQTRQIEGDEKELANAVKRHTSTQEAAGVANSIKRIFDPLGITGKEGEGAVAAQQTMVDYLQETFDRAEREKARLLDQLGVATTALQAAIDKLSAATKEHFDRIAEIDRLRIHVKQNILYYMQAIWSHEPPDQRFFRVYDIDVQVPVLDTTTGVMLPLKQLPPHVVNALKGKEQFTGVSMEIPSFTIEKKKLVEIADLDTVLGYKGNYAIYALNENNFVTLNMMQDYLEVSDEVKLRDPDEFGNYTVEELKQLAECIRKDSPATFDKYRNQFRDLIIQRFTSGRAEDDRVIVPTDSLYIEALVGTHPLLEDFKLIHRALDVKKVQAEVRRAELENIRLAARALEGEREDPDIEKKIVIEGRAVDAVIPND